MSQDRMKCHICSNFFHGIGQCKYCHFEFDDTLPWTNDFDWDIFEIDDEEEWAHLQLQYRLKSKGIDCLAADIWFNNNMAYIIGVKASPIDVANALKIHKEVVYDNRERGWLLINLFQEKFLRACEYGEIDQQIKKIVDGIGELNEGN